MLKVNSPGMLHPVVPEPQDQAGEIEELWRPQLRHHGFRWLAPPHGARLACQVMRRRPGPDCGDNAGVIPML